MRWLAAMLVAALVSVSGPVLAVQPDEVLGNPQLESRARTLSRELRCMVCQNQSIDDSDAPLARDLRVLVRERLVAGDSDTQVIEFLVNRYGEFVLLRPRLHWQTALLWLAPAAVLLLGIAALLLAWRRQAPAGAAPARADGLSAAEEARLAALVKSEDSK
jgi:cytochrome c-type biogenesis protein CcmH